jgi:hypothetical protein
MRKMKINLKNQPGTMKKNIAIEICLITFLFSDILLILVYSIVLGKGVEAVVIESKAPSIQVYTYCLN